MGTTLQVARQPACTCYQQAFFEKSKDMKKKLTAAAFFVACLAQPALGAYVTGFGVPDCGKWLNQKNPAEKHWLTGYMTGLNSMLDMLKETIDPLKTVNSAEQIFVWMDNYCQKNPLSNVSEGGKALFIELIEKSNNK